MYLISSGDDGKLINARSLRKLHLRKTVVSKCRVGNDFKENLIQISSFYFTNEETITIK